MVSNESAFVVEITAGTKKRPEIITAVIYAISKPNIKAKGIKKDDTTNNVLPIIGILPNNPTLSGIIKINVRIKSKPKNDPITVFQ